MGSIIAPGAADVTREPLQVSILLVVLLVASCSQRANKAVIESRSAAVTIAGVDIRGFESVAGWSSSVPTSLDLARTQGNASLLVRAAGYTTLTSQPMSTLPAVGDAASLWIRLPTAQANPNWFGAV